MNLDALDTSSDSEALVPYESVESMTPEARLRAYAILKELSKRVDARLEELKPLLREDTRAKGETVIGRDGSPTTSKKMIVAGTSAVDEIREAKEPDQTAMVDLLATKGLLLDKAFDLVPTPVYNPSKVERLVELGFLKLEEVNALKKSTHVLTVKGSKELIRWVDQKIHRSLPNSK